VEEEDHEIIKKIAKRNNMEIQDTVIYAFRQTFPGDFPEKMII